MSDDEELVDLDKYAQAIAGVVIGVGSGVYAMLTGFLTLDPAFLLSGQWFGVVSLTSTIIGPKLVPSIPWNAILLVGAFAMVGVSLYKMSKNRRQKA